jgi:SAM-dependent methyltransferase
VAGASLSAWYDSPEYQGGNGGAGAGYHDYFNDEENRLVEAEARVSRDIAPLLPTHGGRILEVGCATGSVLKVLSDRGHDVVGVDIASSFVAFGKERHGLDLRHADFLDVPFEPESFDVILLLGTLSNLPNAMAPLGRIHEILKPGGHLFANFPAADSLPARLYGERFWMFTPSISTFYSRAGAHQTLARCGFHDIALRTDRQRPSLGKLLHHAGMSGAIPWVERLLGAGARLPAALPLPGIIALHCRRI